MSTNPDFARMVTVQIVEEGVASSPQVQKGDTIAVHYTGKLDTADGKTFDSSIGGKPLEFNAGLGIVIKGWDEGLLGAKVGEKRNLTIKPAWAYDEQEIGDGLIPPNSTLYFECQIVSINGKSDTDFH